MNRNIAVILSGRDAGLARTLGAASGAIDRFTSNIANANTRAAKAAAAIKFALTALGVVAVVALGAALASAVKFEMQMANVETVAHAGAAGIKQMGNAVLNLSTNVPQTTATLTKGLYDIASSGFYGADALHVLEVSAMAASAGITETGISAKAITAVLNAYGLSAREASDVSDIMFQTVELGVITFEELSSQLGDVIGASAAAGIEFDEVGAAIAAMTLSGLGASEAVTSLNRLIGKIIKPSENLATAFRKMGFESGAAALEQEGLFGVMEKIRLVTGGQIQEIVKLFPEIRAARGAYALLAADGANYARVQNIITNEQSRAGATQEAFNIQMEAAGNQLRLLTNRVQVFGIRVGTALLPVLVDTIAFLGQMGTRLGEGFRALASAAGPTLDSIGNAISEVARLLEVLGSVVSPVARGLAALAVGSLLVFLQSLAVGLELVAGFLADHPGLVRAVAIAYGGLLAGHVLTAAAAFIKLHAGLLLIRAGLAGLAAQAILANVVTRISALSSALYALVSIGNLRNLANLKVAFAGLGGVLTSPALAGAAVIGFLYAFQTGADNARKAAQKWREEIEEDIDFTSIKSIESGLAKARAELQRTSEAAEEYRNVGGFFQFVAETITPLENNLQNLKAANEEAAAATREWEQAGLNQISALEQIAGALGITREEAQRFLDALDFDPTAELTAERLGDLQIQAERLAVSNRQGTGSTDTFVSALETIADPAATAEDRINALTDAINSFVETALGVSNAAIAWEQALDDFTAAAKENAGALTDNGEAFDINTQKGRDVASAFNEMTEAAIGHANAVVEDTGSISAGVDILEKHRQQLINQLEAYGMSEEAATNYVNALGLTPDNISTLIELENAEGAMLSLNEFEYMLKLVDEAESSPTVDIDSEKFNENFIKIGDALFQIDQANPEADVTLNGEKFTPTAEMVTAWADHWNDSSPQAQALLSIIDPQGKFTTLSEAAANWDAASPEASARVNSSDALIKFRNLEARADSWDSSKPEASAMVNHANAMNRFREVEARRNAWDRSSGDATMSVTDHASATLANIKARLDAIRSKTITVVTQDVRISSGPGGSGGVPNRMGGLWDNTFAAQAGLAWQARVLNAPTIFAGERETGGEAFIPKRGNPNRSLGILGEAAGWYGMELRPAGSSGGGNVTMDNRTFVTVEVRAKGSITDKKGLVGEIKRVVQGELDDHDRKLARGLVSR